MASKGRSILTLPMMAGAAAIVMNRFVSPSGADREVSQTGAGEPLLGIADRPASAHRPVDVHVEGELPVEYGGAVARLDRPVRDAQGRAVRATAEPLRYAVAAGAVNADTNIAVAGVAAGDEIVSALRIVGAAADLTANASVPVAGNIRFDVALAANDRVLVVYRRPVGYAGIALEAGVAGDVGRLLLNPTVG